MKSYSNDRLATDYLSLSRRGELTKTLEICNCLRRCAVDLNRHYRAQGNLIDVKFLDELGTPIVSSEIRTILESLLFMGVEETRRWVLKARGRQKRGSPPIHKLTFHYGERSVHPDERDVNEHAIRELEESED